MKSCPLYNNSSLSNTNGNPYALIQKAGKTRTKRKIVNSKSKSKHIISRKSKSRRRNRGYIF